MSVLFKGTLVAAALAIASIATATAQKLSDGTAIIVTSTGEMKKMKHKHANQVPAGYTEVVGHSDTGNTVMIMVNGKMYMKAGVSGRDVDEQYLR
ncbi:MAG: hypothetical protein HYX37_00095 [Rhizobiales bacterium]|nr:hypothetical protein [Hyphomicrobiales bacterium]